MRDATAARAAYDERKAPARNAPRLLLGVATAIAPGTASDDPVGPDAEVLQGCRRHRGVDSRSPRGIANPKPLWLGVDGLSAQERSEPLDRGPHWPAGGPREATLAQVLEHEPDWADDPYIVDAEMESATTSLLSDCLFEAW